MKVRDIKRATWDRLAARYEELSGLRAVDCATSEQLDELRELAKEIDYRDRRAEPR